MSNLPAIPSAQEFHTMKELGQMAIKSGFLPQSIKTPEQACVIILKGRELGIPPMQAFSGINVIQGKPAVSPELMTALIYKNCPGAVINFLKTDNTECVVEAKRPGGSMNKFSFSIEDAKRAGLLDKGNWKTFPAAMLRARCLSAMARALFPDAIAGCSYTPEELGADVDDEGNIITIPSDVTTSERPGQPPTPLKTQEEIPPPPGDEGFSGDYICLLPKFKNKTVREIVAEIGKPALQKYISDCEEFLKKEGKPPSNNLRFLKVNAERYFEWLADRPPTAYDIPLTDEEEMRVDAMINEQRMRDKGRI